MYEDILYVAGSRDEAAFREHLQNRKLQILPERPGGPAALTQTEIERNPSRLLSLKPIAQVPLDPKPFPHYSPAVAPLLDWDVPFLKERLLIAGHIRHHSYMEKKGSEYREIGEVFSDIKKWMKLNWQSLGGSNFIGPEASRLVAEGYSYSSFDPARTTFVEMNRREE